MHPGSREGCLMQRLRAGGCLWRELTSHPQQPSALENFQPTTQHVEVAQAPTLSRTPTAGCRTSNPISTLDEFVDPLSVTI